MPVCGSWTGAAVLLAFVVGCGTAAEGPTTTGVGARRDQIIDGEPAIAGDYPAVGALIFRGDDAGTTVGGLHCTGTLIAPDVVLLAAHCMVALPIPAPTFYFTFDRDVSAFADAPVDLPGDAVEVADSIGHPQFDLGALMALPTPGVGEFFDIGLAFLSAEITSVEPAVVVRKTDADKIAPNARVLIAGYGRRTSDPTITDNGIKYVATSFINAVSSAEMQIGDAAPTPQKCHGDSGGPTFMSFADGFLPRQRVVGVTSHTYDDTDCQKGAVDTRVDPYWDWLEQNMILACDNGTRITSVCDTYAGLGRPVAVTMPQPKPVDDPPTHGCTQIAYSGCWSPLVAVLLLRRRRRRSSRSAQQNQHGG